MAKKELWDYETVAEELRKEYNYWDTIPKRYLKKFRRALVLYRQERRFTVDSMTDLEDLHRLQGAFDVIGQFVERIDEIVDGTGDRVSVELTEEERNYEREREYRDEYFDE